MPVRKYITEQPVYFSADGKKLLRFLETDTGIIAESAELPANENPEEYHLADLNFSKDQNNEWIVHDSRGKAYYFGLENNIMTCIFNRSGNMGMLSNIYSNGEWESIPARKRIVLNDMKEIPDFNGFNAGTINTFFEQQQKIQQAWENHWRAELEQKHDSFVRSAAPDQEIAALTGELERNLNEILEYHHIVPSKFSDAAEAEYFLSAIVEYFETIRNSTDEQLEDDEDLIKLNKACNEIYNFCCRTVDDEAFFTVQRLPMPGLLWLKKTDYTLRTLETALHFSRTGSWDFTPSQPGECYVRELDSREKIQLHTILDTHIATIQQFSGIDDHVKNIFLQKAIRENCDQFNESLDLLYGHCRMHDSVMDLIKAFKAINDIAFNNEYKNEVTGNIRKYASDLLPHLNPHFMQAETRKYLSAQIEKKSPLDEKYKEEKLPSELFDYSWRGELSSITDAQRNKKRWLPLAIAIDNSDLRKVKELISKGVNVNAIEFYTERSMLELAIRPREFKSEEEIQDSARIVDLLFESGAKLSDKFFSENFLNAIYSCSNNLHAIFPILAKHGIKLGKDNSYLFLERAIFHENIYLFTTLLNNRANILNDTDKYNNTILHNVFYLARDYPQIFLGPEITQMLIEKSDITAISKADSNKFTPLRLAILHRPGTLPLFLKKYGIDDNVSFRDMDNLKILGRIESLIYYIRGTVIGRAQYSEIKNLYALLKSENYDAFYALLLPQNYDSPGLAISTLTELAILFIEEKVKCSHFLQFICCKIIYDKNTCLKRLLDCAIKNESLDAIRILAASGAQPDTSLTYSDAVINAFVDGAMQRDKNEAEAKGEMNYSDESWRLTAANFASVPDIDKNDVKQEIMEARAEEEETRSQYKIKFIASLTERKAFYETVDEHIAFFQDFIKDLTLETNSYFLLSHAEKLLERMKELRLSLGRDIIFTP